LDAFFTSASASTPEARIQSKKKMGRQTAAVLYGISMVAVVVGMDLLFFRNRFWERLMVNVGIVLVFGAFYLRFLKGP
jgi:cell division protein FtsW (lipid II flippase)